MTKMRLDAALVELGLAPSREKAKALVMAGLVLVGDRKIDKAGTTVEVNSAIHVLGQKPPYVGRGGLKLARAI